MMSDPISTVHLNAYDIVKLNCELFRPSDLLVGDAWDNSETLLPFNGFSRDSVTHIDLKRIFSLITFNYLFVKLQDSLGHFLMDNNKSMLNTNIKDGVFLSLRSITNSRQFIVIKHFHLYDDVTCKATSRYVTVTYQVREDPSPWIISCRFDTWEKDDE